MSEFLGLTSAEAFRIKRRVAILSESKTILTTAFSRPEPSNAAQIP